MVVELVLERESLKIPEDLTLLGRRLLDLRGQEWTLGGIGWLPWLGWYVVVP